MDKEEFKQIRQELGLSQRKMAKLIGRNYRTLQRYEYGQWNITEEVADMVNKLKQNLKKD